jgi:hypothetical protein
VIGVEWAHRSAVPPSYPGPTLLKSPLAAAWTAAFFFRKQKGPRRSAEAPSGSCKAPPVAEDLPSIPCHKKHSFVALAVIRPQQAARG